MRVKMLIGGSFYGPDRVMLSPVVGTEIEIDDGDQNAVEFWQNAVEANMAEVLEEPADRSASAPPEPAPEPEPEPEYPEPPPTGGAGSSRDAWVAYAASQGVEVTDDMTRDDIVAAVEEQET